MNSQDRRILTQGCVFWVVFSFVAVLVRGVTWDETYEHALAITGIAPYPSGHPFYVYIRNIFSLQSYLTAGMLWLTKGPLLICYLRDVATLLLMTLPLYWLATTLAKRAIWGHVAVVLGLSNAYIFFASHYGIGVWPGYFSVGAIGAGYALLVFAAFMGKWTRTAWFLLALLTAIHLGHWPPLAIYAGFQLIQPNAERRKEHWRAALVWGGAGLSIVLFFFLVQRLFHVPYPVDGPYFAEGDAHAIWINYSTREDVHRFIEYLRPFSHSILLILIVAVVAAYAMVSEPSRKRLQSAQAQILLYAACVASLSLGIRVIHAVVGRDIPFLLIGWMPYRIPNQLAPVLFCMLIAIIARGADSDRKYSPQLWAMALVLMAIPVASGGLFIPDEIYQRYVAGGEYLCFFLLGGGIAVLAERLLSLSQLLFYRWMPLIGIGACALLWFNQFIFACALVGAGFHLILRWIGGERTTHPVWQRMVWASVVIVLTTHVAREWRDRYHLPRTPFQTGVVEYLASVDDSSAMIIPPIWEVEWSARLGVPVFADYGTPRYVTYVPALAPSIMAMHREVFGFNIDGSPNENQKPLKARSRSEWEVLGDEYGFKYIVQPVGASLNLEQVYSEGDYVLYAIPRAASS